MTKYDKELLAVEYEKIHMKTRLVARLDGQNSGGPGRIT